MAVTNAGAFTITWPGTVLWPGGSSPSGLTASGTDLFTFYTFNGGTSYYGFLIGYDLS